MEIKKCAECGRIVPPDEEQIVRDQMTVALQPLAEMLRIGVDEFVAGMLDEDVSYCAACFRARDDEMPLRQWAQNMADDPLQHPAMFVWALLKKGDRHVDP